jgi:hypothetical protein
MTVKPKVDIIQRFEREAISKILMTLRKNLTEEIDVRIMI